MAKTFKNIPPEKPATYKQSWKVAYRFAESLAGDYPDFSEKQLSKLLQGTIYYYHENAQSPLTHGEVQEFLSEDKRIPDYYLEWLDEYIRRTDKDYQSKKMTSDSDEEVNKDKFKNLLKPQKWEWEE